MGDVRYVTELKEWELPRLDDLEGRLADDLLNRMPFTYFNKEKLWDDLHEMLSDRLRHLAESAVNETIEYWLRGLADGNNGNCPELCVELPYLQGREKVDALTVAYCVDNQDGTRTELLRVTLEKVLAGLLETNDRTGSLKLRARVAAGDLRRLAGRLEEWAATTQ